jgi:L-alanine-DL-glutamate epimerase-like enolase superfamily enzyme
MAGLQDGETEARIARIGVARWDVLMRAPYRSAQRVTTTARNVLVTVTLEDGAVGYGESAPATYVTGETQESVFEALTRYADALHAGSGDCGAAFRALRESPGGWGAYSLAALDALARAHGVPLYRELNGTAGGPTEMVTDLSLPILPPDEAARRAAQAAADGFRALKVKVGGPDRDEDRARVQAVAAAAPGATLRLDGNQGFSAEEAVAFVESLSELLPRVEMLEQPTKAGDDAMAFVSARVPCPVFADESCHDAEDATRLIESGTCAGVVLKLAKSGVAGTLAIGRAAREAGGRCMFGCMMETRVATTAALHVALALGPETVPMLDLDGHLLVDDSARVTGGLTQHGDVLRIDPALPGLGLTARAV